MSLESERKVLEKLEKARSAVKRKYHLFRRDKLESQKKLGESFEPLSEPLQKLVQLKTETRELLKPERANLLDGEILSLLPKKEEDLQHQKVPLPKKEVLQHQKENEANDDIDSDDNEVELSNKSIKLEERSSNDVSNIIKHFHY